jgi:hypothetical protein
VGRRRQAIAANHQLFLQLRLVGPVCGLLLRPCFFGVRLARAAMISKSALVTEANAKFKRLLT